MSNKKILNKKGIMERLVMDNLVYWLAFLIPIGIMIIMYMIREIYPFGEEMYLRSDMYHQYAPFHQELANKLANHESLLYSWNIGIGVNFVALAAYYLASPLNLLLAFVTGEHIIEVMSVFIILKVGLAGYTFSYYICKHFGSKNLSATVFGLFYAMSSYYAAFSWNLMWLDCLWLLPIVVLGIERLVKEKKCYMYCISLALAIFSNYYIAIMICIFSVIYYIYLVATQPGVKGFKKFIKTSLRFAAFSLLAGGIAAVVIIPEYSALMMSASGEFDFPKQLSNYFSVLFMFSRMLINVPVAVFEPHDPNIYSSISIFMLVPLYWFNKHLPIKERVGKTIILAIFFLSFNMDIPNYIWHGFHFPNSLPCRQSFIFIFLILVMSYEGWSGINKNTQKQVYGTFGVMLGILIFIEQTFVSDDYNFKIIYISMAFLLVYLFIICSYRRKSSKKPLVLYLLFVVAITEIIINTNETALSITNREYYVQDNEVIDTLVEKVEQEDEDLFYRIEKYKRRTKNDQAWHQYKGMSVFSSTSPYGVGDYYNKLGLQKSYNAYAFYGATPLTSSLFSVKYVFSDVEREEYMTEELFRTEVVNDESDMYMYENLYTLPIGFIIPKNMQENWDTLSSNPFYVQNSFVELSTGIIDMFKNMETEKNGTGVSIKADDEELDIYIRVTMSGIEKVDVVVYDEDDAYVRSCSFDNLNHNYICHLGKLEKGQRASITPSGVSEEPLQLYAYSFDAEKFIKAYEILSEQSLELAKFEDTRIEGNINVKEDGIMYTSISYEPGWKVYVDGKQVTTTSFKNAMLSFEVPEGEHEIELKYFPEGLKEGLIISICCIITIILAVFINKFKKYNKRKENLSEAMQIDNDKDFMPSDEIDEEFMPQEEIEEDLVGAELTDEELEKMVDKL